MSAELFAGAAASTQKIIEQLSSTQLELATPCASWQVRDVINHIVGNTFWFEAIATTATAPDRPDNAAPDFTGADFAGTFGEGSAAATAAFATAIADGRTLALPWGAMPAEVFVLMASTDQFVHGWDLAKATGQPLDLDPDLAAPFLAFYEAAMSDAFRGPDRQAPFGSAVAVGGAAGPVDRLVALLGRQV
jgi:uncharacterized protein (TIGR03086 family)